MENYTITVNGVVYDVEIEELDAAAESPAEASAPAAAPKAAPAAGAERIEAGAAGKVVDIVAPAGTSVKYGETIMILEIMKMETPVVATADGKVTSIEVTKGQSVAAGDLLATLN